MPAAPGAILQDHEGRTALRFERTLGHSPERVWRALIEPDQQSSWHPTPAEFDPREGGAVRYSPEGDVPDMPEGEVTEYDPPRVLAHTWGDDHLRWELRPEDDGCVLVLVHTFDDHFKAARDAAGWHLCLDWLVSSLDGAPTPRDEGTERSSGGWRELNRDYEERFGIPHDKATLPPGH